MKSGHLSIQSSVRDLFSSHGYCTRGWHRLAHGPAEGQRHGVPPLWRFDLTASIETSLVVPVAEKQNETQNGPGLSVAIWHPPVVMVHSHAPPFSMLRFDVFG